MNRPSLLLLTQEAWNEISRHAQETFPEECCGVVLSAAGLDYVHRLKNIQNKLHALDPLTYPRTAAIASAIEPRMLESVLAAEGRSPQHTACHHYPPPNDTSLSDEENPLPSPFSAQ